MWHHVAGVRISWLLVPVTALTDRLRTSARLAVLAAVLLVPAAGSTYAFAGVIGGQVDFARSEHAGVEVLRPALAALARTAAGQTPDLSRVDAAVAASPGMGLRTALAAVHEAGDASTADTAAGRVQLANALANLITTVGDNSKLILDPDLDSFYVMDAQIVQLPKALVAGVSAGAPKAGPDLNSLVAEQAVHAGTLLGAAAAIRADVSTATAKTAWPDLAKHLAPLLAAADGIEGLAKSLTADLSHPAPADPRGMAQRVAEAADPSAAALDSLLLARVAGLDRQRTTTLLVIAGALLVAGWLAAAVWWRNRHDVGLAVTGVRAIAEGDLGRRPLPAGRDELGDIGRALAVARDKLTEQERLLVQAQAAREEQYHASAGQLRRAQEEVRDRARDVVDETATVVERELREVLAQVEAVRVAAGDIDVRVATADAATRVVVQQAREADQVVTSLGLSLERVAGMAHVIAGVADQTKLLALNATIEAARAGTAGKGFTVVAGEVKELAMATARSTDQITSTITSLEHDAVAMAGSIERMTAGIGGVDAATVVLREIAAEQQALVERLDRCVEQAIGRVRDMVHLSTRLD
jgi:methyl-accepting chemotaxis protein